MAGTSQESFKIVVFKAEDPRLLGHKGRRRLKTPVGTFHRFFCRVVVI